MKDKHDKGFSPSRIEDHARTADVVNRARAVTASSVLGRDILRKPVDGMDLDHGVPLDTIRNYEDF